jgi:tryptophan-rich sensory protein
MKLNYFIIPLLTLFVAIFGSSLTSRGMHWYKTIKLPTWTPGGNIIGAVWTLIFILSAISALIIWNNHATSPNFKLIIILFLLNAGLNLFWSYLFFTAHLINWSILEMIILELSVIALLILSWPLSKLASLLLLPYCLWVAFATYLAYNIAILNK